MTIHLIHLEGYMMKWSFQLHLFMKDKGFAFNKPILAGAEIDIIFNRLKNI